MILGKNTNYFRKVTAFFLAFFLLLGFSLPMDTFALNSLNSKGKAGNFLGYRIKDDHTIQVWFDKPPFEFDAGAFKIFSGIGTEGEEIPIEGPVTSSSEKNITSLKVTTGTGGSCILTTAAGAFKAGQVYTLVINNNYMHGTGPIGWFTSRQDISFSFTVPDTFASPNGGGTYSSAASVVLNSWPQNNASNVAVEGNIWFNTSIPVENYSEVRDGIVIKKNGVALTYNNYMMTGVLNTADLYAPIVTDDHTFFVLPLTAATNTTTCYNLEADAQYEVTIPEMHMVNGEIVPQRTISFHTAGSTVASKFTGSPQVSQFGDDWQISWTAPTEVANVSPVPSGYNVYVSTDKYWNYVKLNTSPITDTSFITSNCGLKPNTTYYFRISALSDTNILTKAKYDLIESGFSGVVEAVPPVHTTLPNWSEGSVVNASNVKGSSVTLSWTAANDNDGITAYRIYKNDTLIDTVDGNITSYDVVGLNQNTEYTFKIEAGDASNNWSTTSLNTTVKTLNTAFQEIGSKTVDEGKTLSFGVSAVDPDGNALTYSAENLPKGATFDSQTKTFKWTPDYTQAGTYIVKFVVNDGTQSVTKEISIVVKDVNRAPAFAAIENKIVNEGKTLTFAVKGLDADGDPLTYSASGLPKGAKFDTKTKTFTWTPGYTQAGTYKVMFIVKDGKAVGTKVVTIVVKNVNRAPKIMPIANKTIKEGQKLSFTVKATDADGDKLTYSVTGLPKGAKFDIKTKTFTWTPGYTQVGTYKVTFVVKDGKAVGTKVVTIVVKNVNRAPKIMPIANKTIKEGQKLSFTVKATDADGDKLTYSASGLPRGAKFDTKTKTFTWTPGYTQAGAYKVKFVVKDGKVAVSKVVTIVVKNANKQFLGLKITNKMVSYSINNEFSKSIMSKVMSFVLKM